MPHVHATASKIRRHINFVPKFQNGTVFRIIRTVQMGSRAADRFNLDEYWMITNLDNTPIGGGPKDPRWGYGYELTKINKKSLSSGDYDKIRLTNKTHIVSVKPFEDKCVTQGSHYVQFGLWDCTDFLEVHQTPPRNIPWKMEDKFKLRFSVS